MLLMHFLLLQVPTWTTQATVQGSTKYMRFCDLLLFFFFLKSVFFFTFFNIIFFSLISGYYIKLSAKGLDDVNSAIHALMFWKANSGHFLLTALTGFVLSSCYH